MAHEATPSPIRDLVADALVECDRELEEVRAANARLRDENVRLWERLRDAAAGGASFAAVREARLVEDLLS